MSTNPVLVPISLVSQFLATEKMASRHWFQCQMECLLDQVFDQLSTKFEDYLASNAITGTAHHSTIDTETIQHQHEPSFQAHSHAQVNATTDHLINTEFPVAIEQLQNGGYRCDDNEMDSNGQVYSNGIDSQAVMSDQAQYPHSLSVPTSNLGQSNQNNEHGEFDLVGDDDQARNNDIEDDADRVNCDEIDVKEEIDDSYNELFTTDQKQNQHSFTVPTSNLEQSNQNGVKDGANDQYPNEDDDATQMDKDEIVVKEEFDTDNELITFDQNSQIAKSLFATASNKQSIHNWTNENDEEYNFDNTRDDEQPIGFEYGDIDDDAPMDCDEVEVKEEIDDTNNQLIIELHHNPPLPASTSNDMLSNGNDEEYGMEGDDYQQQNEHLKDGTDEINEHNKELSRSRKKPRLETTQPNNKQSRVSRQSSRLENRNQTDQDQHINQQANFDARQPTEEADKASESNNQDKQIIELNLKCLETDCPLMFNNKTELNAHMSTQHDILPHRCLVKNCKQSFSNQTNLRQHFKQVHPNTTHWHCDKCSKLFPTYKQLSTHNYHYHQLGHYQCAFTNCTSTGDHRHKIYNHYSIHHKIVEFTCQHPNCGRRFNNKSNLKVHQQAHLGIKPYRCKWPSCGYAATTRRNAMAHIKRMHLTQNEQANEQSLVDPREYIEVLRD